MRTLTITLKRADDDPQLDTASFLGFWIGVELAEAALEGGVIDRTRLDSLLADLAAGERQLPPYEDEEWKGKPEAKMQQGIRETAEAAGRVLALRRRIMGSGSGS